MWAKSDKKGGADKTERMQPAPIKGNKIESGGAIRQPKLVSIFQQFRCKPISTPSY